MENGNLNNSETPTDAKRLLAADWISVKDQLPEYNLPVLVCQAGEENSVAICRLDSKTERKESVSCEWLEGRTSYDNWYYDVTHWQRLPAAANG